MKSASKEGSKSNMICGKRIKDFFYVEEANEDMGFISNTARFILTGMSVWQRHSRFVIPSAFVGFFGVLMLLSKLLYTILNYDNILDWLSKVVDYGWVSVYLSAIYIVTYHKEEIQAMSEELDRWWNYSFLEEETAQLKKKSEDWMRNFRAYYVTCSLISWTFYVVLPAAKFFYKGPKQRGEALIFATWTPFPLHTTWGYSITYGLEVLMMAFAQCLYCQLFLLVMTFAIVIGHQMRLVGTAFLTIFKRVDKMMKNINFETKTEFYEVQNFLLDKELRNGVIHFQHLYSCAFRLSKVFSSITNVTYHGGMWVMCSIAVKAATEMTFVVMLQAIMMIGTVIISQYVYSFINESLIEEVQKLRNVAYDSPWYEMPTKLRKSFHIFQSMLDSDRFPTLRTIMGSQTNMENLSKHGVPARDRLITRLMQSNKGYLWPRTKSILLAEDCTGRGYHFCQYSAISNSVINASYCYFSMLITIKSRYETTSTLDL